MTEPAKFGVKVCRERKCPDLQADPMYPKSPQMCAVTHGMPGSMHCCIKEMDAEAFIRRISGQLNDSDYGAQRPGVKNCPKECPYKIFVDGEKFIFERGKPVSRKVPAKIGKCALTGSTLGEAGSCPCNVLGNPDRGKYIKDLAATVRIFQGFKPEEILRTCHMRLCPDGKGRCTENKGTDCPLIRVPFKDLKECPLWRIPAKMLPAPANSSPDELQQEKPASSIPEKVVAEKPTPNENQKRAKVIREEVHEVREEMKRMSEGKSRVPKTRKKKRLVERQSTLTEFGSVPATQEKQPSTGEALPEPPESVEPIVQGGCGTCGHHKGRKTFHESCPRKGELLFAGGTKSATKLMFDTSREGCRHWFQKPEKETNRTESRKSKKPQEETES